MVAERQLWLAVLRAQAELGIPTPDGAIDAYQAVVDRGTDAVDLESIARRERVTRHDVKARLEEFAPDVEILPESGDLHHGEYRVHDPNGYPVSLSTRHFGVSPRPRRLSYVLLRHPA